MMDSEPTCPACQRPLPADAPQGLCPQCLMKGGLGSRVEIGTATTGSGGGGSPDQRFVPPAVDQIARFFPQLEVLELIGQGGMGAVYKARQKELDRVVALKILPPGIGDDAAFAERFAREAQAMAKLSHPGVVTIHDFGQTDGLFYFLMEFVDGVTLRQLMDSGEVSPREALAIVPQICDALSYAHDQGIVHRDIKPENVLLDRQGRVKVADFGLAKLVGIGAEPRAQGGAAARAPAQTEAGKVMGTPQYMAPEQRERPQEVDHRADIYSLGVVFYQLLTGELPSRPIEPPSKRVQIDVRLDEVVLKALESEPQRRYQRASEIKTRVETIATTPPEHPLRPALDHHALEESRRQVRWPANGLLAIGILNCLVIPMVVLFWSIGIAEAPHAPPSGVEIMLRIAASLAFLVITLIPGALTIYGALKMKRLEAYWLALAAIILAVITSPFCLIPLPIGVWALVVLSQREVRAAFAQTRKRATGSAGASPPRDRQSAVPAVGRCLSILARILFLLPPAVFIWFLLAGHLTLGVDLDADVHFFVGLLGLPLSAGVGAVLAWSIEILRRSLGWATDAIAPGIPRRWCWQAILSVVVLVFSLPFGGGAIVLFYLGGQDVEGWKGWNPGTEELVVTLSLLGGAFLTAAAATLLGIEALRRIGRASVPLRGRFGALAAAWFWPCMLAAFAIALPFWEKERQRRAERAREQVGMLLESAADVEAIEIPDYQSPLAFSRKEPTAEERKQERLADVADVPAQDLTVDGNDKMRYFLIGAGEGAKPPEGGYKLVVVMPGGDGGEDFHPFVRRLYKHAMSNEFLVAQPVAFQWLPSQTTVWPTRVNATAGQKFTTEEFVEAVIEDVKRCHSVDQRYVFTLSWSSSGPAAYAISLQEETAVKGSYVAMSVFRREWLPPLDAAKDRLYLLDHSPEDTLCPFSHAKQAEQDLTKAGATVRLSTYPGGHGWRGDVYARVRNGIAWLVGQVQAEQEERGGPG